jgi:aminopeptidase YwaD
MPQAIPASKPFVALPTLWAIIMLVLTLTPAQEMPRTPNWEFLAFDTAAHAGVFGVLAILSWYSASRQRRWPWLASHAGWAVLVGCVLFGGLIEVLQYVMHVGRQAEWTDLVGDSLGAALALLVVVGAQRWWLRRAALVLLVGYGLTSSTAYAQDTPSLPRARRTIEALAAEKMHGRGYVQQGEHHAAAYLRGRLRQLGLQPLAPDYTQSFTLDVNTFPGNLTAALLRNSPAERVNLRPGLDFIAAPACPPLRKSIFYIDAPDTLAYQNVVATAQWLLTGRLDTQFSTALVLRQADEARLAKPENGALATRYAGSQHPHLIVVPKLTASLAAEQSSQPCLQILAKSLPTWASESATLIELQVDADLKRNYQTQNLAALVRGRAQPDSFLVVSAHYDHLGMMSKKAYFPGANDNASGVSLLLELASHYAQPENQPACSIAFLLFGAEEAGLVGSTYFVQHPLVPLASIKFLVNLDLLGTGEEGATVVNGRLLPAAFQRLSALNDARHYLPRLTARGAAANSDHYPFSQAGVPAFFMYTRGGSLAYHDVHDRPEALSLAGFAGAYGLVRDFLDATGAHPIR